MILEIIAIIVGGLLILTALNSAIRTLVLPRGAADQISRVTFIVVWMLMQVRLKWTRGFMQRDRLLAYFAPLGLMALVPTWMLLVSLGYALIYFGLGVQPFSEALRQSGSSLLTLGFASLSDPLLTALEFSEAAIGLILAALLVAYLPTIYNAFQRRESLVTLLEVRAGSPPSAIEMLSRYHRIHGLNQLNDVWRNWEAWFADVQESHTSLSSLAFFRSPLPQHSWITAAGAVLDTASLTLSTVDIRYDAQAALCIRAGYLCLRQIADFYEIDNPLDPRYPETPISVRREEFDAAVEALREAGVPLKADLDQAWLDFAGWRVNYDACLLGLASMIVAPWTPWSSDRMPVFRMPRLFFRRHD